MWNNKSYTHVVALQSVQDLNFSQSQPSPPSRKTLPSADPHVPIVVLRIVEPPFPGLSLAPWIFREQHFHHASLPFPLDIQAIPAFSLLISWTRPGCSEIGVGPVIHSSCSFTGPTIFRIFLSLVVNIFTRRRYVSATYISVGVRSSDASILE